MDYRKKAKKLYPRATIHGWSTGRYGIYQEINGKVFVTCVEGKELSVWTHLSSVPYKIIDLFTGEELDL